MKQAYLIIDIGTGNVRVGVVSETGEILAIRRTDTHYLRDSSYEDAWYFDPLSLWEKICICIEDVLRAIPEIYCLSAATATSAREGIVLLDNNGSPFLGLPNIDNRGQDYIPEDVDVQKIYSKTGRWISPVFSAAKLIGFRALHPQDFERIQRFTSISDWVGYMFTGKCVYEYSQACETQLFDIKKRSWSEKLCRFFNIPEEILPPLISSGAQIGVISKQLAHRFGVPENIPFIVSGADTQTAIEGIGSMPGDLVIVSGTTTPLVRIIDDFLIDENERCWLNCHIRTGQYLLESNAGVTGLNFQRFKALFFPQMSYDELEIQMNKKSAQNIIASLGTLIFKENCSLKKGGFLMQSPIASDIDQFDFALGIVRDIAFSIVSNYENHLAILPYLKDSILGCGGGLKSKIICQTISTLTSNQLILPKNFDQASLLGCARICATALGTAPFEQKIFATYEPGADRERLEEYYIEWNNYRKKINDLSEIKAL